MEVLPADADDEALVAAVHRWVDHLAAGEDDLAVAFLCQEGNANRMAASGAELREWLGRYESSPPLTPGPPRVTPAGTAGGPFEPLAEVFRADDGTPLSVDFSMPINGEWSDLVAFFVVVRVPGGLALALSDMYVA
jgi:hypothetical protein